MTAMNGSTMVVSICFKAPEASRGFSFRRFSTLSYVLKFRQSVFFTDATALIFFVSFSLNGFFIVIEKCCFFIIIYEFLMARRR